MQISVQIGLNWNWPTGTELGNKSRCPRSILTWGLGAVILMLIISNGLSISKKILPVLSRFIPEEDLDAGRSLEQVSSLAQHAFEAFEKYQALNEKKN